MDYEALIQWILALDDATCADLFREARYGGPHPADCPRCGTFRFGRLADRVRVDVCKGCGAQLSVTAGTALHALKQPLAHVLVAAVLLTRPGSISINALSKLLDVSWQSARHLTHRVRRSLVEDRPRLRADARLATHSCRVRRDRGEVVKPVLGPPRMQIAALLDPTTGAGVVQMSERRCRIVVKRLVDEHLAGVEEIRWPPSCEQGCELVVVDNVLGRVHKRVSRRWLQLYAGALLWGGHADWSPRRWWRAVQATLGAPRRTWTHLRPARVQSRPI